MIKKALLMSAMILLSQTTPIASAFTINSFDNIGKIRTNLPETKEVISCVNDSEGEHMDSVELFVKKYFDGETKQISFSNQNFYSNENVSEFLTCEVINFSIGRIPLFFGHEDRAKKIEQFKEDEYYNINHFLDTYEGFIIAAAGNDDDTIFSSPISRYKEKSKALEADEDDKLNRLIVVGQVEKLEDGKYKHHYSYGDEIDFFVPNYNEDILNYKKDFTGTSFASPVVSGLISQLLKSGIPTEDIRNILGFEDEMHYYKGKSHKVLSVTKTIENAYSYHQKNSLN